jgi:hypothetical protein
LARGFGRGRDLTFRGRGSPRLCEAAIHAASFQ